MSNYEKQNFTRGQILKADHLNHMENGIEQLSEGKIDKGEPNPNQYLIADSEGNVKWEEKLCYEEEHDIVFVEETTVTGPYGQFFTTSEWPLKEGCSYEVTYNGETYNCVPFTFSGQPCLGNAKMASTSLPDTGEPFIITGIAPKMYSYVMFKNNTTHTFSVRGPADVITKIPSKYLSASITAGTGLNANAMNGLPAENASGDRSHAEGRGTAIGYLSHAEGTGTAKGAYSHAEGFGTITSSNSQHAQGQYNVEDAENKYAHIVGNGTYDARSNAHTIDWDGNGWFAGTIKVGGTGQDDEAAQEVALKSELNTLSETVNGMNRFVTFVKNGNNIYTGSHKFNEIE